MFGSCLEWVSAGTEEKHSSRRRVVPLHDIYHIGPCILRCYPSKNHIQNSANGKRFKFEIFVHVITTLHSRRRRSDRDGKLADEAALCYYLLLPIAFDFGQIPRRRNKSTTEVVGLSRCQVLYRRSCQPNRGIGWNGGAELVEHVRLDRTGVDREDLDFGII